nr:transposase [Streptomyces cadmiisoli]
MGKIGVAVVGEVLVTVGIDTHVDVHVAVALDQFGRKLDVLSINTTGHGHRRLLDGVRALGTPHRFGVEGTGAYGAGLTRYLRRQSMDVVEVIRPTRQTRRRAGGKNDAIDAEAAARAVQAGTVIGEAKSQDGPMEMIRTLRLARRSAMKARTQAANQLHAVVVTAPQELRDRLRSLSLSDLVATVARFRPGRVDSLETAAKLALKSLAVRYQQLACEISELNQQIDRLAYRAAPELMQIKGVGHRRGPACGSRRQRQPAAFGSLLRPHVRRCPDTRQLEEDQPQPSQPRRQPGSKPSSLHAGEFPPRPGS